MSKKILVTGASGFIGTYFIKNTKKDICYGVDLLTKKMNDICFEKIDSVLHLAAIVHQSKRYPEEKYYKINRDLTFDLAIRAKAAGVKQFVMMSTVKVFGKSASGFYRWNEKSSCYPIDAYAKSKLEAENLIKDLEDENFKIAIIRSPLVYGEGVKANMLNLIKKVDFFPVLPLDGINNSRSIVYVGNLVALMLKIIQGQFSGIFIAGDESPISTTQLVVLIAKSLGKKECLIRIPRIILKAFKLIIPSIINRLFESLEVDNSNTNKLLQFIPPFSTNEGIDRTVNWYKSCVRK